MWTKIKLRGSCCDSGAGGGGEKDEEGVDNEIKKEETRMLTVEIVIATYFDN